MKLCFVTTNDWISWGGSEELWFGLATHCIKQNHQIAICIKNWKPLPSKISELSKTHSFPLFLKNEDYILQKIYNKFKPNRFKSNSTEKYKKQILRWHPDAVIISQGGNIDGVDMMNFLLKHQIPYITISQAVRADVWPDEVFMRKMQNAYSGAVHNYFVSNANYQLTELQIAMKLERASVVRNPFNVPFHNKLPYPNNHQYNLACVARYDFTAKGQDVLLQVMNERKWRERDVIVNLYGSGQHQFGIEKLIRYLNLPNVLIKGFAKTVDIWTKNNALVLSSRFEGLPLALVEAMLCGRFGIVTNVSGNKEVILDDVNGFIAEAPAPEYLDNAMERAWTVRNLWEEIGMAAKQYIHTLVPENPVQSFYEHFITLF